MTANILNFPVQRNPEEEVKFDEMHKARLIKEVSVLVEFIVHLADDKVKDMGIYCEKNQYIEGLDGVMYLFELETFFIYRLKVLLEKLNNIGE